ncbi:MAG TPA: hypothetical protein VLX68_05845 [Chitinivibrionales bacterium]|nr:hypothetical protein [Chitinivibrionales bacterium]
MKQILKRSIFSFFTVAALVAPQAFGQQTFDGWAITPAQDARAATMTYANPSTYLKIESDFVISVDAAGAPASGIIHFKNGFQRAMTAEEIAYYYPEYGGINAYWDFRDKQGTISTFDFATDAIPQTFVGRQVRVISKAGKQYIGLLNLQPSTPGWFSLNVRGNSVMFEKNAVKEIQAFK